MRLSILFTHGKSQLCFTSSTTNISSAMGQHYHSCIYVVHKEKTELEKWLYHCSMRTVSVHTAKGLIFRKKQGILNQKPYCLPCAWSKVGRQKLSGLKIQSLIANHPLFPLHEKPLFTVLLVFYPELRSLLHCQGASDAGPMRVAQQLRNELWIGSMSTLKLGQWTLGLLAAFLDEICVSNPRYSSWIQQNSIVLPEIKFEYEENLLSLMM